MDLTKAKQLRRSLTLHFAIIAWLTAMLVATGSGSIFLPVFIFFVCLAAFVFVDTLEWFEVGRVGSYIGMTTATTVAVSGYIYSAFYAVSESGQLMAVAGLLVYPEAVLFLQRKNLRIYEQLAVFLLLEMIVAALVNDNLLFGILLTPIMLLWVSSLFLFSRYATLVHVDPSIETPTPKLAEVLFQRFMTKVLGDSKQQPVVSTKLLATPAVQSSRPLRRAIQSFPIGIGALAFAGLFFYLLPRTQPSTFRSNFGNETRIGLPERLTFGAVGKILQDRTPVMRVSLKNSLTRETYSLKSPPYLRARVLNTYDLSDHWLSRGEWKFLGSLRHLPIARSDRARALTEFDRDLVSVEFDIKGKYASWMYTLPPIFGSHKTQSISLEYDPLHMVLRKQDASDLPPGKSLVYEIGSAAFADAEQVPVAPARLTLRPDNRLDMNEAGEIRMMLDGFRQFSETNRYRQDLLDTARISENDRLAAARLYEEHFVYSGAFTYSLDLSPPSEPGLDPIEDFVANQRRGHCQYFASAMVAMLRQSGIPSRVVIGYHPKEFNKLGQYFLVRQSDAHAWAEGLFRREDLVGTSYERWLTDSDYYWVRFDPTPAAPGEDAEIVEQQGQAIDYAEKLWKDYVVEGQKLNGENSLYAPVAENSKDAYNELVESLNSMREDLAQGRVWNGEIGFAWPLAILIFVTGGLGLLLWRMVILLPKIAPRLARRLGVTKRELDTRHQFYARCLRLLERLGIRRRPSETPLEFSRDARKILEDQGQSVDGSLDFLTNLYYVLRFGGQESPTHDEKNAIDAELRKLEEAVSAVER